MAGGKKSP